MEQIWDDEWEANLLQAAVERVKERFDARQFQLFELTVLQGWSNDKVRAVLDVGTASIYLAKHRVSKAIKKELSRLKQQGC